MQPSGARTLDGQALERVVGRLEGESRIGSLRS